MGVGMTITVAADNADRALEVLKAQGENAYILGEITEDAQRVMIA